MRHPLPASAFILGLLAAFIAPAHAATLCTIATDAATGAMLLEQGDCDARATPASTFKIALAVMGYDAGVLQSAGAPVLPFRDGYPAWGGDNWTRPTDPENWMRHSVVWYSQQITKALGVESLARYATAFAYGNADFAGDPGKDNALERAWISSSLTISPREQVAFLGNLVTNRLPVSAHAIETTKSIVERHPLPGGWTLHGKTGSAYPRNADGSFDRTSGWGWYVGWAVKDDATILFARLTQDEQRHDTSAGIRTRDGLMAEWAGMEAGFGR